MDNQRGKPEQHTDPDGGFVPAGNKLEAVSRISALTGSPPETLGPGSKERRSVLVNLGAAFDIAAPPHTPKPALGRLLADRLGAQWDADCWSRGDTITLVGLNRLLQAGEVESRRRRDAARAVASKATDFASARSKLEAVSRISALTQSEPETLGPGGKERKSALINLALRLRAQVNLDAPKPALGQGLAGILGVLWDEQCWSAGNTITLVGLNRLLEGAERAIVQRSRPAARAGPFRDAAHEAAALLAVLSQVVPQQLDGRRCVEDMLAASSNQWAQDEWAGFFFEFVGLPALVNTFAGGPVTYANTRFDYALGDAWDLKVHSGRDSSTPLNAIDAIEACLRTGRGVGFLVLSGEAAFDDGEFRQWHRDLRAAEGRVPAPRADPPKFQRRSKVALQPALLEAFYFPDLSTVERALTDKVLAVMKQGRQASGASRRHKYSLHLGRARSHGLLIASREL